MQNKLSVAAMFLEHPFVSTMIFFAGTQTLQALAQPLMQATSLTANALRRGTSFSQSFGKYEVMSWERTMPMQLSYC